jgi:hypothetical protein
MDERTQPTDDGSAVIWSVEAVRYYSSKQTINQQHINLKPNQNIAILLMLVRLI